MFDTAVANRFIVPCGDECRGGGWVATGSLQSARELHTATLLPTCKVLVAGGRNAQRVALESAELYDPATGTWTPTGSMSTDRFWFDATVLQEARISVAGGATRSNMLDSTEIYDPASGRWTRTGDLNVARYGHTLKLLDDGTVLAARGSDSGDLETTLSNAERYDPRTGTWSLAGDTCVGSVMQSATRCPTSRAARAEVIDGPAVPEETRSATRPRDRRRDARVPGDGAQAARRTQRRR